MTPSQRRSLLKSLCEDSYYLFFKEAWGVLEPETPFVDNWHVEYLCDILQSEAERISRREERKKHLIINIPPRSLKSSITTIMFNAWVWINYPEQKFITASYSAELAQEHAQKTRKLIESDWYQSNWSDRFEMLRDSNAKSKFENDKSGSRRSTSVGGSITGQGADYIIADDPINAEEGYSEVKREKAKRWYATTMHSRLNDLTTGLRLIVMQRLHEEDITGVYKDSDKYRHICIPARRSEELKPKSLEEYYKKDLFFPERFTDNVLLEAKEGMGSLEFEGQYQQAPSPPDGNIIKRKWFKYFDSLEGEYTINTQTDGAYGKEDSDNSATIVYSVVSKELYIWAVYGWNKEFPDFIESFKQLIPRHDMGSSYRAYFEPKAMGISAVQTLKNMGVNAIEDKAPTESKESRVRAGSASIEAGRVHLYSGGVGMEDLVLESIKFPTGANDDRIDALAMIISRELKGYEFEFASNY